MESEVALTAEGSWCGDERRQDNVLEGGGPHPANCDVALSFRPPKHRERVVAYQHMSQIPSPISPVATMGPTVTSPSGRFQMMNVFQSLFDAHTQKFIAELERVKDETLTGVRRNLVEQSQNIAESLTQSHNLQMAAINAVLATQAKQHESLKLQHEAVRGLPNAEMWDTVLGSVHALEARLAKCILDEDGEHAPGNQGLVPSTSVTTSISEPVTEYDDFVNIQDGPPSLASSPGVAEVPAAKKRRCPPSGLAPLQPIQQFMPLAPLESKPKISSLSRSSVPQLGLSFIALFLRGLTPLG
ncbi:hypothetical protein BS47DRAFT_1394893 [Hydnum rufescens UP504]|uniref:Uncharacterized protein n=1 Tax=Hydnum rufescens UP504 TaxID=1448309 RepID=A0A9P6ATW0_9AGAM|nr:hypothetical protein BS47DRAFT_1394893 [Hydnum rufescens UP504]